MDNLLTVKDTSNQGNGLPNISSSHLRCKKNYAKVHCQFGSNVFGFCYLIIIHTEHDTNIHCTETCMFNCQILKKKESTVYVYKFKVIHKSLKHNSTLATVQYQQILLLLLDRF